MSELVNVEKTIVADRSLNVITTEIVAISNQTRQLVVMSAVEIGRRLVEAKRLVGHGEWGSYLSREVAMSQRSANDCMRLFKEFRDNPNSQALANLSYTNAVRLLALPETERQEVLESADVANMSSRELDRLIKERDELKMGKEQAESRARQLETAGASEKAKLTAALAKGRDAEKELLALREQLANEKASREKAVAAAREEGREAAIRQLEEEKAIRATEAEKQQEAERKKSMFSDPDAAAFKVLFEQIQSDFNRMNGHLKKIEAGNPEQAQKLRFALRKLVETMGKQVGDAGEAG